MATIQFRSVQQRDELGNPEEFTSDGAYVVEAARLAHIQDDGLPRIGTPVVSGTLLIAKFGATKAYRRENLPNDLELLTSSERALIEKYHHMFYDASVYAPAGTVGRVSNACFTHDDGQTVAVVEVETAAVSGPGTGSAAGPPSQWSWEKGRVIRGGRYRVIRAFVDADGNQHPVGEEWVFVASMFSRYDDLLILCVQLDSGREWKIPLVWTPQAQQDVIENVAQYIAEAMTTSQIAAFVRQWFEQAGQVNGPILPDGWFGRPYDNQFTLEEVIESDDAIALRLSQEAVLHLTRPRRAIVERSELVVDGFDGATFEWKDAGGADWHAKRFTSGQVRFVPPIGTALN